jgi:hypothetical protein
MKDFIKYFTGLKRNYGYCNIKNGEVNKITGKIKFQPKDYGWAKKEITNQDYEEHLSGGKSIGVNPCDDEGLSIFGAIDIDPKDYSKFNLEKYLKIIEEKELPIIPVKSKSGGLHLYVFTKDRVKASEIRDFLEKLLFIFGLPSSTEIFPKQTSLDSSDGKRPSGNFINLPYYNKKERVALKPNGEEIDFDMFMKVVNLNAQTSESLSNLGADLINKELKKESKQFEDGPPCLGLLCGQVESSREKLGDWRDRFLFNYMVFAKRKYPDEWEEKILETAREYIVYDKIWGDNKVKEKIKTWKGDTAGYLCNEDPIQSRCARNICLRRKYGVGRQINSSWPEIISVTKIAYRPHPKFILYVKEQDGKIKNINAKVVEQIIEQRRLRALIAENTSVVPEPIKQKEFQAMVSGIWATQNIEIPDPESQPAGILFRNLKEYLNDVRTTSLNGFKSGSVYVENDKAYFLFYKFFEELRRNDWRMDENETKTMVIDVFKAESGKLKRIGKGNPIRCMEVDMKQFESDEPPEEIIEFEKEEDIV